ncbi:FAD:protein FMN transferase [Celeribacter neptunius]|uniref:FAD:protein FMN transferase n=1 Tax=Celeribacter neptunius TaxID=588602 RepID=A0A1I3UEY6_9RHOB|nr:FAD:protein FMN transferase [Celeribacter neptunius]SFJ80436.1 thiamine biosynthesis lipoprotein [Celeribacter neptunius]
MLSTSFEGLNRIDLNGPTMGTRWQAQFWLAEGAETAPIERAMQAAVDRVDAQMSLWRRESDLCRLNAAPVGAWVDLGDEITRVLTRALEIGQQSGGAFEIAMGPAVAAWGFGPEPADPARVRALLQDRRPMRARELLELDVANHRARKHGPARFDLNGIAKGFGTDRLIEVAQEMGLTARTGLTAGIDGDLRCLGTRPDGSLWPIAIEEPDYERRAAHSLMELGDTAIATSGDYRHWVDVGSTRLSHTMNPDLKAPVTGAPASVTVLAPDCMSADGWATALMVLGRETGSALARANGIQAMFLERAP